MMLRHSDVLPDEADYYDSFQFLPGDSEKKLKETNPTFGYRGTYTKETASAVMSLRFFLVSWTGVKL